MSRRDSIAFWLVMVGTVVLVVAGRVVIAGARQSRHIAALDAAGG